MCGEDFDKRVLESKKDTLILIQHPLKENNRKLSEMFEEYTRMESGKSENKNILFARYNGVNESQSFKNPGKLPALIYFRNPKNSEGQPTGEEKEIIKFEGINELLLKSTTEPDVHKRLS